MEVTLFQGSCGCIPELWHHRRKTLCCDGDQSLGHLFGRENIKRQSERGGSEQGSQGSPCKNYSNWGKRKKKKDGGTRIGLYYLQGHLPSAVILWGWKNEPQGGSWDWNLEWGSTRRVLRVHWQSLLGEQTSVPGWDQLGKEVESGKLRAKRIPGVGKKGFGEWEKKSQKQSWKIWMRQTLWKNLWSDDIGIPFVWGKPTASSTATLRCSNSVIYILPEI